MFSLNAKHMLFTLSSLFSYYANKNYNNTRKNICLYLKKIYKQIDPLTK